MAPILHDVSANLGILRTTCAGLSATYMYELCLGVCKCVPMIAFVGVYRKLMMTDDLYDTMYGRIDM